MSTTPTPSSLLFSSVVINTQEPPLTPSLTLTTPTSLPSEIILVQPPPGSFQPLVHDNINYSHLTGNSYASSVYQTNDLFGGFCAYNQTNPAQIESICNGLDKNVCSSTQCCVLIGGEKCVAGNENGPTNYSNYSDPAVFHRDLYYYQGKCYGNCQNALKDTNVIPSVPTTASTASTGLQSQSQSQSQQTQPQQTQPPTNVLNVPNVPTASHPIRTRRPAASFSGRIATRRPPSVAT
jgi:hypothetical protein